MNTELIEMEFDEKDVFNRPGSYGKLLTYISYPAYVRRMNLVFDYNWSCDVTQLDIRDDEVIAVVKVTAEGTSKMQAGGKRITKNKNGQVVSLGDDVKSAITIAFKKASQMFGIGLYLCGSDDDEEVRDNGRPQPTTSRTNGTITESQLKFIKELRASMGMSVEEVKTHCQEMFKTEDVMSLNTTQASTFIQALKVAQQNGGNDKSSDGIPF
jgi:hypothetical protein